MERFQVCVCLCGPHSSRLDPGLLDVNGKLPLTLIVQDQAFSELGGQTLASSPRPGSSFPECTLFPMAKEKQSALFLSPLQSHPSTKNKLLSYRPFSEPCTRKLLFSAQGMGSQSTDPYRSSTEMGSHSTSFSLIHMHAREHPSPSACSLGWDPGGRVWSDSGEAPRVSSLTGFLGTGFSSAEASSSASLSHYTMT